MAFSDPFGLCKDENGKDRPCKVEISADGRALGANMDAINPETRQKLQQIADAADVDLGINATNNGQHTDFRHYVGDGVDIGEINGQDIGTGSTTAAGMAEPSARLQSVIGGLSNELRVANNLGPAGKYLGSNGPLPINDPNLRAEHMNHVHVTFNRGYNRPSGWGTFNQRVAKILGN